MLCMEATPLPPISLNSLINIAVKVSLPWRDACFHSGMRRGSCEQRGGNQEDKRRLEGSQVRPTLHKRMGHVAEV